MSTSNNNQSNVSSSSSLRNEKKMDIFEEADTDILQHCFSEAEKQAYTRDLLGQHTMTNLVNSIMHLEQLPSPPCHLTPVFTIPKRPKSGNSTGAMKGCGFCGSYCNL